MSYVGEWIIVGCYDAGNVIDFKKQMQQELPSLNYEDVMKNDSELNQTLSIDEDGTAVLDTKSATDGKIMGILENDVIIFNDEKIPIKMVDDYLVFCIDGGFVFVRSDK